MSHDAGVDITFRKAIPSVQAVIDVLEQIGWSLVRDSEAAMWFVPFDEDGALEQQVLPGDRIQDLLTYLQSKMQNNETFGAPLFWQIEHDILLIFTPPYRVLGCSINNVGRRLFEQQSRLTDINWYYQHVVLPLEKALGPLEAVVAQDMF